MAPDDSSKETTEPKTSAPGETTSVSPSTSVALATTTPTSPTSNEGAEEDEEVEEEEDEEDDSTPVIVALPAGSSLIGFTTRSGKSHMMFQPIPMLREVANAQSKSNVAGWDSNIVAMAEHRRPGGDMLTEGYIETITIPSKDDSVPLIGITSIADVETRYYQIDDNGFKERMWVLNPKVMKQMIEAAHKAESATGKG